MINGFYEKAIISHNNDFSFLEEIVENSWDTSLSLYDYIHGYCAEFATCLKRIFGYEIKILYNCIQRKNVIHVFCEHQENGKKIFIDARGCTDDFTTMVEEYEDFVDLDGDEWVVETYTNQFELCDEHDTMEIARNFISTYYDFYDTNSFIKKIATTIS